MIFSFSDWGQCPNPTILFIISLPLMMAKLPGVPGREMAIHRLVQPMNCLIEPCRSNHPIAAI